MKGGDEELKDFFGNQSYEPEFEFDQNNWEKFNASLQEQRRRKKRRLVWLNLLLFIGATVVTYLVFENGTEKNFTKSPETLVRNEGGKQIKTQMESGGENGKQNENEKGKQNERGKENGNGKESDKENNKERGESKKLQDGQRENGNQALKTTKADEATVAQADKTQAKTLGGKKTEQSRKEFSQAAFNTNDKQVAGVAVTMNRRVKQVKNRTGKSETKHDSGFQNVGLNRAVSVSKNESKQENAGKQENDTRDIQTKGDITVHMNKRAKDLSESAGDEHLKPVEQKPEVKAPEIQAITTTSSQPEVTDEPSSSTVDQQTETALITPSLTAKKDSLLPELAVTKDSLFPVMPPKNILYLVAGADYLLGWQNNGITEGKGFNPVLGIIYENSLSEKMSLSLGAIYRPVHHFSSTSHTSAVTAYKFGEESEVTVISAQKAYYIAMPLKLNYKIDPKSSIGLGYTANYLVEVKSKVETYLTRQDQKENYSVSEAMGYKTGFNALDGQLAVCYRRLIYKRLGVNCEVFLGLSDLKKNKVYHNTNTERSHGARITLSYDLIKK